MTISSCFLSTKNQIEQVANDNGREPLSVQLVAVSKYSTVESILEAYSAGCRVFGESRVQDLLQKIEALPKDIQWHLIGSLQKNKVRKVIGKCVLIHSVHSFPLLKKIDECSLEEGVKTSILLQVNVSGEESKQGLSIKEWRELLPSILLLKSVKVEGLMTMAPFTEDKAIIKECFNKLKNFREELLPFKTDLHTFAHLSMGMSMDYPIAIAEGATLVRVGSAIFS